MKNLLGQELEHASTSILNAVVKICFIPAMIPCLFFGMDVYFSFADCFVDLPVYEPFLFNVEICTK